MTMENWWTSESKKTKEQVLQDYENADPLRIMSLAEAASGAGLKRFFSEQINSFAHPETADDMIKLSPLPLHILKDMACKMGIPEAEVFEEIERRKIFFNSTKG